MRILARHDDGTETDITLGVQTAYDIATSSLDWGSGLLDYEEQIELLRLAKACGFTDLREKAGEVWRSTPRQLSYTQLTAEANRRGFKSWYDLIPTDEEIEAMLSTDNDGSEPA